MEFVVMLGCHTHQKDKGWHYFLSDLFVRGNFITKGRGAIINQEFILPSSCTD